MANKQRKPPCGFVSDLIQLSPRVDMYQSERVFYAMGNHSSKTNFIGEGILTEGPRAVAVTETGEKHSILLDDKNTIMPVSSTHTSMVQEYRIESTPQKLPNMERPRMSNPKRTRASRRYSNQRPRLVFTPRNINKGSPRLDCAESRLSLSKPTYYNVQTQTEFEVRNITDKPAYAAYQHHTAPPSNVINPKISPYSIHATQTVLPASSYGTPLKLQQRLFKTDNIGDRLDSSPQQRMPLRILASEKSTMRKLSELRSIASALTLVTIISWLFSTYFEMDGVFDLFESVMETLQHWYVKKEQPMTKAEMFVQYLRNLWS